jgi:hypothetical protein
MAVHETSKEAWCPAILGQEIASEFRDLEEIGGSSEDNYQVLFERAE